VESQFGTTEDKGTGRGINGGNAYTPRCRYFPAPRVLGRICCPDAGAGQFWRLLGGFGGVRVWRGGSFEGPYVENSGSIVRSHL
jgi:hypothetical protein